MGLPGFCPSVFMQDQRLHSRLSDQTRPLRRPAEP